MSGSRIGAKPPKYLFFLNPYNDVRFTRCPKCQRLTNLRKFAFLIHIDGTGLVALGKTSRFCPSCELIIVHRDELEPELARIASHPITDQLSIEYLLIGTVPLAVWKSSMRNCMSIETVRHLAADFKKQLIFTPSSDA